MKMIHVVTEAQCVLIHDRLMAYRPELAHNCSHEKLLTGLDYATGFSYALVKNILDKVQYINSLEAVKYLFPFYADGACYEDMGGDIRSIRASA